MMLQRYLILTPVLDDWASLSRLIDDISGLIDRTDVRLDIIAVDDGSTLPYPSRLGPIGPADGCIERIEILRLALNLGHQRAIAVGLSLIAKRADVDGVIVMDSDGEDRPEDIPRLIAEARLNPDHVIFAYRARRSEGMMFKVGYRAYRLLFRIMTGRNIAFGNFSLLPMRAVHRMVHVPDLWNNLPATIIRSRIPYRHIDTTRGTRYEGTSRMNVSSLIVHGLSAMSVYADIMFVRILMAASIVCVGTVVAMGVVLSIRLATSLAIPGWTTTAFGSLLIILFQAFLIMVVMTLVILASRSNRPFVPIADSAIFIEGRVTILDRTPRATVDLS